MSLLVFTEILQGVVMQRTIFDTPFVTVLGRIWAHLFLGAIGWKEEGGLPDAPKYVMIAAPHTTNWDLPIMLALGFLLRVKLFWMTKDSVFRWPFGGFFKWLGGIPIDRSKTNGVVGQCVEMFEKQDQLVLAVPPEGTRKKVRAWKTGFYHIAVGANVPIAMGYLDYKRRRGGIAGLLYPSGDYAEDLAKLQEFYATITPKYPELTTPAVAPKED